MELSILEAVPALTPEQAWNSVYQITTYHVGGVDEEAMRIMADVGKSYLKDHRPAWTAVGVEALVYGKFEITVLAAIPETLRYKQRHV